VTTTHANLSADLDLALDALAAGRINSPMSLCETGAAAKAEIERLRGLINRVIEWKPAFPVESGLLDELAAAVKGLPAETSANRMPVRASSEGEVSTEQHVQASGLRAAEVPCSPPLICVHGHAENCPYCPPRLHPETKADAAYVRGLVFDHVGWVCSVCRGWNSASDAMCVHQHVKANGDV
jgi:hypothetical protein